MNYVFLILGLFYFQKDLYFVSHVQGKILFAKTRKGVLVGDEISPSDSLIFSNKNDLVAIVSPQKGRMVIKADRVKKSESLHGLLLAVRDNFFPETKTNTMATRAGLINNLADFESYLQLFKENSTKLLIIDSLKIPLNTTYFNDRNNKFFFLQFQYKGDTINKRLSYEEPLNANDVLCLVLNKNIYTIDGKNIPTDSVKEVSVFYYDSSAEKSIEAGSVQLKFVSQKEIKPEVNVLLRSLDKLYQGSTDKDDLIISEIQADLKTYYGLVDKDEILKLLTIPGK